MGLPRRKRTRADSRAISAKPSPSQNGVRSAARGSPKPKRSRTSVPGPKRGRVDNRKKIPHEKLVSSAMSEMGLSFKIDTAEATETLRNKILEEHIELPVVLVPALRPVVADYYIEAAFNARKIRSTGSRVEAENASAAATAAGPSGLQPPMLGLESESLDQDDTSINGNDAVISSSADPSSADESELGQPFGEGNANGHDRSCYEIMPQSDDSSTTIDRLVPKVTSSTSFGSADVITTVQIDYLEQPAWNGANKDGATTSSAPSKSDAESTAVNVEIGSEAISAENLMGGNERSAVSAESLMDENEANAEDDDVEVTENASAASCVAADKNKTEHQFDCQDQVGLPGTPVQDEQSEESRNGAEEQKTKNYKESRGRSLRGKEIPDFVEKLSKAEVESMGIDSAVEDERSESGSEEIIVEDEKVPVESARQMAPTDDEIRTPVQDERLTDGMQEMETPSSSPIAADMIVLEEAPDSDEKSPEEVDERPKKAMQEKSRRHRKDRRDSRGKEKHRPDRSPHSKFRDREKRKQQYSKSTEESSDGQGIGPESGMASSSRRKHTGEASGRRNLHRHAEVSKESSAGNSRRPHHEEKSADAAKIGKSHKSGAKLIDLPFLDDCGTGGSGERRERQRRKPEKPEKRPPPATKSAPDVLENIIRGMGSNNKTNEPKNVRTESSRACTASQPQPQQPATAPNLAIPLSVVTKPSMNQYRAFPPQSPGISPTGPGNSGAYYDADSSKVAGGAQSQYRVNESHHDSPLDRCNYGKPQQQESGYGSPIRLPARNQRPPDAPHSTMPMPSGGNNHAPGGPFRGRRAPPSQYIPPPPVRIWNPSANIFPPPPPPMPYLPPPNLPTHRDGVNLGQGMNSMSSGRSQGSNEPNFASSPPLSRVAGDDAFFGPLPVPHAPDGLLQPHAAQASAFASFDEIMATLSREFTVADSVFRRHPGRRDEAFKLINYIDQVSKPNGPSFVNLIQPDEFARIAAWARRILHD